MTTPPEDAKVDVLREARQLLDAWCVATVLQNLLSWPVVFAVSSVVTVIVAFIETRRPSYHGVGWQKLNPRLPEWWESAAAGGAG